MKTLTKRIEFLIMMVLVIQSPLLAQVATLTLTNKKIRLPENNFQVTQIFDARIDKKSIGLVYDYMNQPGIKKMVNLEFPLNIELMSLFEKQNIANPFGRSLFIKVNKLKVSDNGGVNELYRLLEINLDFYIKENDVYYHEFTAGKYIASTRFISTQKIDNMILDAITNCYSEFLYRLDNNLGYHKEVAFEDMKRNTLIEQAQNESFILKGENRIFYTFNMFRDSIADAETKFLLKNVNRYHDDLAVLKYLPNDIKTASASAIWGVVYENNLYVQVDGVFIRAYPTNDGYMIMNMISFKNRSKAKEGSSIAGGFGLLLGSIIGGGYGGAALGLITGGIGAGIGALSRDIKMSDDTYKIDMITGLPIKSDKLQIKHDITGESLMVFYSRKIKGQYPELFINDELLCQFESDSYYIYSNPDTKDSLNICLKIPGNSWCESITADFVGKRYFEVIIKSNGKMTLFEKKQSQTTKYVEGGIKKRKLRSLN